MPLPEQPAFEALLQSLCFEKPERETEGELEKGISFWVKNQPNLSFLAFLKRLVTELERADHPVEGDLISIILAISACFSQVPGTRVGFLNRIITFITTVDVT